jgi:hypothetical protein
VPPPSRSGRISHRALILLFGLPALLFCVLTLFTASFSGGEKTFFIVLLTAGAAGLVAINWRDE